MRKGAGRGTGKGYKNLRSFPRDASIHSQSAKGMKQPQRLFNIKLLRVPYGKEYAPLHWREYTMKPGGAVGTIKEFDDFFEGQNVTFDVDMTMQEKIALTKKANLKDTDKDGVGDVLDCRKYNPHMQDITKESLKKEFDAKKETFRFKNYEKEDILEEFLKLGVHTEQNPLTIDDYPYGFSLRTKIRYWVETTNKGDRFVSQTLNPKTEQWNKPKKSVYSEVMVLVADNQGHVTYMSMQMNDTKSKAKAFLDKFGDNLSKLQIIRVHKVIGWDEAMKNVTFTVRERPFNESREVTEQKNKEQDKRFKDVQKYAVYKAKKSYLASEGDK